MIGKKYLRKERSDSMKLSVIVPCYNEGLNINVFYEDMVKNLKENKLSYELIFVNDGSTDDTLEKLKDLSVKDKNVKIINFSRNFGKEAAMQAGLEKSSGSYISIIDADMQQKPSTLISMYNKLIENKEYDVVCAYRESRDDDSKIKAMIAPLFYKLINKVSNVNLVPGASDFRVFKKEVKDAIISLKENNRFLKGIFSWVGFNTIYVPYTPDVRLYGTSKWSLLKLVNYGLNGIISFSSFPLYLIFYIAIFYVLLALLNAIFNFFGYRTMIFLLALILISISTIGLYISKIYNNALKRPNYIIKELIGFNNK